MFLGILDHIFKPVFPKVGATAPQVALARFRGEVGRKGAIGGR